MRGKNVKYYKKLLDGKDKPEGEKYRTVNEQKEDEKEITIEEVERQIRKLKKEKAPGGDGITNEVWMYGSERVIARVVEIMNRIWKGKGFSLQWRGGIIIPIYKKGSREETKNYRGITLLSTMYKVYAMVIGERLKSELEEKKILPDSQGGFREGRGTIDNVYILNHLIEKEIKKKLGKMYALFVDLRAAFDSVDRKKLWECMREKGISERLVRRIEEIYSETKNRVRVNGKESEYFWNEKGVRQGCPLSSTLFTIYISEIVEMFKRAQAGGVVIGKEKVWCLAYADDMVFLSNKERGMKKIIKNAERYIRKKKLEVNTEKTKMVIFKKGGRRAKEIEWKWEGKRIKQKKQIKYLEYIFNERNTSRVHVKEMVRKANKVLGIV